MFIIAVEAPTTPAAVEGVCPDEQWEEFGEYCYYFSTDSYPDPEKDSWDGAIGKCKELAGTNHRDATLASIHNRVTNEWIYQKYADISIFNGAWIGLRRTDKGMLLSSCNR